MGSTHVDRGDAARTASSGGFGAQPGVQAARSTRVLTKRACRTSSKHGMTSRMRARSPSASMASSAASVDASVVGLLR